MREWDGSILRMLRKEKGWTQKDLATASGVGETNICRYEGSRRGPDIMVADALAQALGCTLEQLLSGGCTLEQPLGVAAATPKVAETAPAPSLAAVGQRRRKGAKTR